MVTAAESEGIKGGQPINFLGIHWDMNTVEMTTELESQGYRCDVVADDLLGPYPVCRNASAVIDLLIRFNVVEFSCETFKGCELSQDDIMQWLITFGLVEFMDEAGSDYYGESKYCGDGVLGDAICVDSSGKVFLHRGRLRVE